MTHRLLPIVDASASAAARLEWARAAIGDLRQHRTITIIGASRGAADDFARILAASTPATFGVSRFSLTQFAARTALLALAGRRSMPSTPLVAEAVATRAAFDAAHADTLDYFGPVAGAPGFPRALARTLNELRAAGVDVARAESVPLVGADLARLLRHFEQAVGEAGASDRAGLYAVAGQCLAAAPPKGTFVLLDLPSNDAAERLLIEAMVDGAERVIATIAPDDATDTIFTGRGITIHRQGGAEADDLAQLRRYLFDGDARPPQRELDGSLELFSAPGEGREAIEIARRVLHEAKRGVRFDEMAVLVRSPHSYFGLIEHAMARAGVPVWFDRGTRRPHPAGRAFLALLACAIDGISAVRFAEYLSLAQVPGTVQKSELWSSPHGDVAWRTPDRSDDELEGEELAAQAETTPPDAAVVAGTLRAPWRWESLIVDARIIGGGAARWKRRLAGHRRELQRRMLDAAKEEGADAAESAEGLRIQSTLMQLGHLETFALPVVETLETWTDAVTWGEWLDRFTAIAPRVLRQPAYVLRVLGELRPMAAVGPITLDEARRVLADRLSTVEAEAPTRRYGRVFVGTPQQARGRSFRIVFVPGLTERSFPQKPREDPLLLDVFRGSLDPSLATHSDRIATERQLLKLCVTAASERLYVSYPRIELSEARARVPSFYALDLLRASTGQVPGHEVLEEQARKAGGASLAWPAPAEPTLAIDEVEHDLAVLRRLLDDPAKEQVRGHAHYLLAISEPLRRAVIERWRRATPEWSPVDGITRVTASTADALARQRLTARSYSPSALQRFASCPYQFVLSALFRLQPLEEPAPLERIDPMTRGSLIHEVQARLMRQLRESDLLPLSRASFAELTSRLDDVMNDVAERAHEELAPAIDRVWKDDVEAMRRDLHGWIERMAADTEWVPRYFEFGFGRVPGERDPASAADPVTLDGGFALRGAIDLIESHASTGELRVTDYKTGRPPEKLDTLRISGGTVLQPIMYGLAAERALGKPVREGRLFFCTTTAGYRSHPVRLDEDGRRAGVEVLEIIDRAIARGALMAAPAEHACERCDFSGVCGPDVPKRVAQKRQTPLADLFELRSRR